VRRGLLAEGIAEEKSNPSICPKEKAPENSKSTPGGSAGLNQGDPITNPEPRKPSLGEYVHLKPSLKERNIGHRKRLVLGKRDKTVMKN